MSKDKKPHPQGLDPKTVEDALKRITVQLLQAHKRGERAVLDYYARQAGLSLPEDPQASARLFARTIQVYHPDRLAAILERVTDRDKKSDERGLEELRQLLRLKPAGGAKLSGIEVDIVFDFGFDPGDLGFGSGRMEDHQDAPLRHESGSRRKGLSFREALRREHFGNLDLDMSTLEMEELDGELVLADYGIDNLAGIGHCKHITSLNLSCNRIWNLEPLKRLKRLEYLDVSHNLIDEAHALEDLKHLSELDLSGNSIEEFDFLENLPRLRYVNISGNPLDKHARDVFTRLRGRGVIVV